MCKVGIIDSGINQSFMGDQHVIQGIFLKKDNLTNEILTFEDINDQIGHGSECFKIISSITNNTDYFIVKIFDYEMVADVDVLVAAIRACLLNKVNIINISAGVTAGRIPESLGLICDEAYDNNVAIFAARHNLGSQCYPAHYKNVIGVGFTNLSGGELYKYTSDTNLQFFTSASDMYPDDIIWANSTSFACAKMTAHAANMLKFNVGMNIEILKTELISQIKNSDSRSKNE